MIKTKKKFKKFKLDNTTEMAEYESILNNPLCTITEKQTEKENIKDYNDRGVMTSSIDNLYYLVHWEERVL